MKGGDMRREYNPAVIEDYWYKIWKKSDLFKSESGSGKSSFSILLPSLHEMENTPPIGEALTFTIPDIIIRRKKMQGFNILYLTGLNGNSARLAGSLGLALDWGRVQFTPNEKMQKAVVRIFIQLYNEGNIYRGDYTRYSCPTRSGNHQKINQNMIGPNVSKQWFLKTAGIVRPAIDIMEKGKITFIPEIWKKEYLRWMTNIRDWCISRQLSVGYRIPAYYCTVCRCLMVREKNPLTCDCCNSASIIQDPDVLDIRFFSALWPFAALGWQDQSQDFKDFYPTSLMVVNHGRMFFQAARMIMMGIHVCSDIPFRDVLISSRIWGKRNRMDKTPNNIGAPVEGMIAQDGADALRFTLAIQSGLGQDTNLSMARLKGSKAFINKIWNAARHVLVHFNGNEHIVIENVGNVDNVDVDLAKTTAADRWILNGLNNTVVKVNELMDGYNIHKAADLIFRFFRREFCNWYLEFSRCDMENLNTRKTLIFTLFRLLQMLHPFMPFITEEIYHKFERDENRFLIQTAFPSFNSDLVFPEDFADVEVLKKVIKETRKTRTENSIEPKRKIDVFLKTESVKEKKVLEKNMKYFDCLTGSTGTLIVADFSGLPRGFTGSCPNWKILVPLKCDEDRLNMLIRLSKEAETLDNMVAELENKLSGQDVSKDVSEETPGTSIIDFKKSLRATLNRRDKIRKTINDLL